MLSNNDTRTLKRDASSVSYCSKGDNIPLQIRVSVDCHINQCKHQHSYSDIEQQLLQQVYHLLPPSHLAAKKVCIGSYDYALRDYTLQSVSTRLLNSLIGNCHIGSMLSIVDDADATPALSFSCPDSGKSRARQIASFQEEWRIKIPADQTFFLDVQVAQPGRVRLAGTTNVWPYTIFDDTFQIHILHIPTTVRSLKLTSTLMDPYELIHSKKAIEVVNFSLATGKHGASTLEIAHLELINWPGSVTRWPCHMSSVHIRHLRAGAELAALPRSVRKLDIIDAIDFRMATLPTSLTTLSFDYECVSLRNMDLTAVSDSVTALRQGIASVQKTTYWYADLKHFSRLRQLYLDTSGMPNCNSLVNVPASVEYVQARSLNSDLVIAFANIHALRVLHVNNVSIDTSIEMITPLRTQCVIIAPEGSKAKQLESITTMLKVLAECPRVVVVISELNAVTIAEAINDRYDTQPPLLCVAQQASSMSTKLLTCTLLNEEQAPIAKALLSLALAALIKTFQTAEERVITRRVLMSAIAYTTLEGVLD